MRIIIRLILGLLSGLLGALAGWAGLAYLVIATAGPDRDGGIAMGAFFGIGPIGGVIGFIGGVLLFIWKGIAREKSPSPLGQPFTAVPAVSEVAAPPKPTRTRLSRPFAAFVLIIAGGLAWAGWYEFIRSPYLTHGADAEMTLALQFRLPPGVALPEHSDDIEIEVSDGDGRAFMTYGEEWFQNGRWFRRDGDRLILLASAELSKTTYRRAVRLKLPQASEQVWSLGMDSDPYPIPDYTSWRTADSASDPKIEMRFRLTADRCSVCAFDKD
jgi:MFS family permease